MLALFRAVLVDMRQYSEGSLESARAVIRKGTRMVQPAKSQDFLNSLWDRGGEGSQGWGEIDIYIVFIFRSSH